MDRKRLDESLQVHFGLIALEAMLGAMALLLLPLGLDENWQDIQILRIIIFGILFILFWVFFLIADLQKQEEWNFGRRLRSFYRGGRKLQSVLLLAILVLLAVGWILFQAYWPSAIGKAVLLDLLPLWLWLILLCVHSYFIAARYREEKAN